ncbi:MAG: argininosuccinate lyase [Hydrogenobacter sp.]|uniref:argininosuccinate lyase n=1 Tax=Hydrogenobacter thermophilus TaxID=940 RepID=UPI0030FC44CE
MRKPWEGRFKEKTQEFVEKFTQSVSFDKRLALEDITQSLAHIKTLYEAGILTQEEMLTLQNVLEDIKREIQEGRFVFSEELEDVHMNIEAELIRRSGEVGGKLHTGRSRNDQIATDEKLYIKKEIKECIMLLKDLRKKLVKLAENSVDVIMPAYTHLQRAQPIRLSHYFLAYREMFLGDELRFCYAYRMTDFLPLGSGAVAGVDFPLNRFFTAKELNFRALVRNSLQATSDRDYVLDTLYACAVVGMHLSRLSEDLILWSTQEFGFVELPDRLCTGSSIMPQKKNPDVLELIRGKTGRLYGNLLSLLTSLKGLPTAYNRDLQEDKEPLFDSIDTVKACIEAMNLVLDGLSLRVENMTPPFGDPIIATDLANYLVMKGLPFREAHRVVGNLIAYLLSENRSLGDIKLEELRDFSPLFDEDALSLLDPKVVADRRRTYGGTAKEEVLRQIEVAKREEGM